MILTVTLNPALDVTYSVPALVPHTTNRVDSVRERAGGKGVNVARVLHTLGWDVLALGLCGGTSGALLRADLDAAGIPHAFVPVAGETRRVVTVVDSDATVLTEPGPRITPAEWSAFTADLARRAGSASVVVLSGSLPRGLPADAYATLVGLARAAGAKVLLDTSGPALLAGGAARPDLIKPNAAELAESGLDPAGLTVALSRGKDGILLSTPSGCWSAAPPEVLAGNPTGAGDAAAASLALTLAHGNPWPVGLMDAVALSAAAVVTPEAGDVDLAVYRRIKPNVIVEETSCPW